MSNPRRKSIVSITIFASLLATIESSSSLSHSFQSSKNEIHPQNFHKESPQNESALGDQVGCQNGLLTFELSTGFIYKPSTVETLAMLPSTLQLTDCLNYCLNNASCLAINFEVGLCVLLSSSAKQKPQNLFSSQFPVFTIYAEKKCLLAGKCNSTALSSNSNLFP